uniref:Uncharacterized protein n=1 Tax=Anguilla anguilla TaxID=7936 RepID=A0A0E9P615_ANGAN
MNTRQLKKLQFQKVLFPPTAVNFIIQSLTRLIYTFLHLQFFFPKSL